MHALRIWFLALDKVSHLEDAVLEHRAILDAIRDGDAERAAVRHADPRRRIRRVDPPVVVVRPVHLHIAEERNERDAAMSTLPAQAKAVIIGAGIVGNSMAYHLARLGWTDLVQIDKGPLPNPGGSTGHASNFIFPVDHAKEMAPPHARQRAPVQGDGRLHRVRRHRGRPHRGADAGAAAPHVSRRSPGASTAADADARRVRRAGPLHGPRRDPRRLLHPRRRRGRLAARRHDHAREGA